jgi:hypothetical protein
MPESFIHAHASGSTSFVGPDAVGIYRATVIESALRFYARTGMRVNRAYTPTAMMRAASEITGRKFKTRDYIGAADAIHAWRHDPANIPLVLKD